MNTRMIERIIGVSAALLLILLQVAPVAQQHVIEIVDLLKERALHVVVEGDSHVDPGDYRLQVDEVIIGLWKRVYGYGYVNVTDEGVRVKAAFSKASMGMAGVYVKFTRRPLSFKARLRLSVEEDLGGVIEVVLHKTWYNGSGGDKPGSPLTQIIVYPKYGLALIGNIQRSIGKTKTLNIELSYNESLTTLTVNGFTAKSNITSPPTYITLMALSTDPGLNITFTLESFNITYSLQEPTTPPTITGVNETTSTPPQTTTHTCTTSTPEIASISFNTTSQITETITSSQKTKTSNTISTKSATEPRVKITSTIVSNATITIVYPNGSTFTSIVPVTRKQVSGGPFETPMLSSSTPGATSSVESRVFNTTFYMILLVAVIVVIAASIVFSRRR